MRVHEFYIHIWGYGVYVLLYFWWMFGRRFRLSFFFSPSLIERLHVHFVNEVMLLLLLLPLPIAIERIYYSVHFIHFPSIL